MRWVGVCKPDKFKLTFSTLVFLRYSYFFGVLDPEKLKEHETVVIKKSKNIFYHCPWPVRSFSEVLDNLYLIPQAP